MPKTKRITKRGGSGAARECKTCGGVGWYVMWNRLNGLKKYDCQCKRRKSKPRHSAAGANIPVSNAHTKTDKLSNHE